MTYISNTSLWEQTKLAVTPLCRIPSSRLRRGPPSTIAWWCAAASPSPSTGTPRPWATSSSTRGCRRRHRRAAFGSRPSVRDPPIQYNHGGTLFSRYFSLSFIYRIFFLEKRERIIWSPKSMGGRYLAVGTLFVGRVLYLRVGGCWWGRFESGVWAVVL